MITQQLHNLDQFNEQLEGFLKEKSSQLLQVLAPCNRWRENGFTYGYVAGVTDAFLNGAEKRGGPAQLESLTDAEKSTDQQAVDMMQRVLVNSIPILLPLLDLIYAEETQQNFPSVRTLQALIQDICQLNEKLTQEIALEDGLFGIFLPPVVAVAASSTATVGGGGREGASVEARSGAEGSGKAGSKTKVAGDKEDSPMQIYELDKYARPLPEWKKNARGLQIRALNQLLDTWGRVPNPRNLYAIVAYILEPSCMKGSSKTKGNHWAEILTRFIRDLNHVLMAPAVKMDGVETQTVLLRVLGEQLGARNALTKALTEALKDDLLEDEHFDEHSIVLNEQAYVFFEKLGIARQSIVDTLIHKFGNQVLEILEFYAIQSSADLRSCSLTTLESVNEAVKRQVLSIAATEADKTFLAEVPVIKEIQATLQSRLTISAALHKKLTKFKQQEGLDSEHVDETKKEANLQQKLGNIVEKMAVFCAKQGRDTSYYKYELRQLSDYVQLEAIHDVLVKTSAALDDKLTALLKVYGLENFQADAKTKHDMRFQQKLENISDQMLAFCGEEGQEMSSYTAQLHQNPRYRQMRELILGGVPLPLPSALGPESPKVSDSESPSQAGSLEISGNLVSPKEISPDPQEEIPLEEKEISADPQEEIPPAERVSAVRAAVVKGVTFGYAAMSSHSGRTSPTVGLEEGMDGTDASQTGMSPLLDGDATPLDAAGKRDAAGDRLQDYIRALP